MTPEESGDSAVDTALAKAGVDSVEELAELALKQKNRDGYDSRQSHKIRELQEQIAALEERQQQDDLGIGEESDETTKRMARELRELNHTVTSLAVQVLKKPGDDDLAPFMDQALEQYPEFKKTKDPVRRMDAYRRIARDLKAEADGGSDQITGRDIDTTSAHLTGGGSPVSRREGISEEEALAKYEQELAAASKGGQEAIHAKYRSKYPHWGI